MEYPNSIKDLQKALADVGVISKSRNKPYLKGLLTKALNTPIARVVVKSKKLEVKESTPKYKGKKFEGFDFIRVLGSGHTKTHYHCLAMDGDSKVTVHIPKTLFKN